jgi:hypothetical protein
VKAKAKDERGEEAEEGKERCYKEKFKKGEKEEDRRVARGSRPGKTNEDWRDEKGRIFNLYENCNVLPLIARLTKWDAIIQHMRAH